MITHPQLPSAAIDLSGLTYIEEGDQLLVVGTLLVDGVGHAADGSFAPGLLVVQPDGSITGGPTGFAHLAWHDGEAWHVIVHPAPEA